MIYLLSIALIVSEGKIQRIFQFDKRLKFNPTFCTKFLNLKWTSYTESEHFDQIK